MSCWGSINALVDRSPCFYWFKYIFLVWILSGKYFRIRSEVNPVHETKLFLLMSFINVLDVGEKHAAWKYFAKYCPVLSLRRMTFMDWGECVCMVAAASVGDYNNVL